MEDPKKNIKASKQKILTSITNTFFFKNHILKDHTTHLEKFEPEWPTQRHILVKLKEFEEKKITLSNLDKKKQKQTKTCDL